MIRHRLLAIASSFFISQSFCQSLSGHDYIEVSQINANELIEDRFCYGKLTALPGYTASVFDGHGGSLVAEYASQHLHQRIDKRIKQNLLLALPTEKLVQKSVAEAYDDIQNQFLAIFKQNISKGQYHRVGACALTAVILKGSLHIANAGDCEGVLLSKESAQMVNLRLNAGEKFEQQRLRKQFPDEDDIIKCHNQIYCYVKGRLQPTRSFGDFYLKYKQYNVTRLAKFTGPYIDHRPLFTHFNLNQTHQNLILATDGLWDQIDEKQIHQTFLKRPKKLGEEVFNCAIGMILNNYGIKSIESLKKIQQRRNMHDDITVLNIKLKEMQQSLL